MNIDITNLIQVAFRARENAYAPYSKYKVGAALITDKGSIYTGCNVENASYGATMCAERTAVFKAVSEEENIRLCAVAIVGGPETEEDVLSGYAYPCGMCRQVMREFADDNMQIFVARSTVDYKSFTLGELFPESFGLPK